LRLFECREVRSDRPPIAFNYKVVDTCSLTTALSWYEQQLNTVASQDLNTTIAGIAQVGTFACRDVNSEAAGPRSEHATADAIDIVAFHLADGRTISLARDTGTKGSSTRNRCLIARACALADIPTEFKQQINDVVLRIDELPDD
jgi:hypothetical protein